ncbi:hypothetical protein ACFQMA_23135 [Halosimplex aquaticum]|uniref:Uncharacterized protein n=1 Tax=Halosimplex aquaticum TaxID=3026162 RepID=A0ABD5Y8S3_9EURY|nr:hypothetical protein [Halosimplex aquaticum]
MSSRHNRSALDAYKDLDIGTALALMLFAVVGLVQTGLMLDIVELLTKYKFLPLAASYGAYAVVFASSGTRNPSNYHPIEWVIVTLTAVVMTTNAFMVEVQTAVSNLNPWASVVIMVLMIITGAILGK